MPPLAVMPWFQSTPPARGATLDEWGLWADAVVSIHAPRAGSDRTRAGRSRCGTRFNPRPPRGERQALPLAQFVGDAVSIHAPRAGERQALPLAQFVGDAVSIHAPRAGSDAA